MRKVFSSNEPAETMLIRDALVQQGIAVTIQNALSGRSAVPEFRPEAEIWLDDESDYEPARKIVTTALAKLDSQSEEAPWSCSGCKEDNPASFEVCWNCSTARPA